MKKNYSNWPEWASILIVLFMFGLLGIALLPFLGFIFEIVVWIMIIFGLLSPFIALAYYLWVKYNQD